ncbi:TIGR02452 family protein [Actinoplanes couchii]|uniref:TIGR02452 family protein n=2 Tax=Actinoplanes couchii TaxID=403638 RepID=A0ABQ3X0D0_9ACTN|nr:TIGR02452 family protein [Actinoplanes couchii]
MAHETVSIVERGWYEGPAGRVDISVQVAHVVTGTRLYLPDDSLPPPLLPAASASPPPSSSIAAWAAAASPGPGPVASDASAASRAVTVEITGESSLDAARRLGAGVACLNFASARNPGGGFLNGAQAQEESIARSSAIYPSLRAAGDFYAFHRADRGILYTDRVIYSPEVPVFRDDRGRLLPSAYPVSFLTAAAPNRAMIVRDQPHLLPQVSGALTARAERVLRVAASHGHRNLVLGAWGCGVFGNDPSEVAQAFAAALTAVPSFDRVVFAILDRRETIRDAFRATFH